MWSLRFIETLIQDLRYGARTLLKQPGFTLLAALTLALIEWQAPESTPL